MKVRITPGEVRVVEVVGRMGGESLSAVIRTEGEHPCAMVYGHEVLLVRRPGLLGDEGGDPTVVAFPSGMVLYATSRGHQTTVYGVRTGGPMESIEMEVVK